MKLGRAVVERRNTTCAYIDEIIFGRTDPERELRDCTFKEAARIYWRYVRRRHLLSGFTDTTFEAFLSSTYRWYRSRAFQKFASSNYSLPVLPITEFVQISTVAPLDDEFWSGYSDQAPDIAGDDREN